MTNSDSPLASLHADISAGAVSEATPVEPTAAADDAPEDPTDRLYRQTAFYIGILTLMAMLCVAFYSRDMVWSDWPGFVTLVAFAVVFERVGIKIYGDTHVSSGVVAIFAIGIVYGAPGAAIAAPVVVLAATALSRSRWHVRLFDMSSYTLANVSAALVFHALVDVDGAITGWWVPAALVGIVVNYVVNAGLVSALASKYSGDGWLEIWREEHSWIFPYYIVFGLLALALATAYRALEVPGIMAFVAPPLMMRFALQQYVSKTEQTVLELKQKNADLEAANRDIIRMSEQLTETYDGTLEALVLALDARDRETKGHSFRVAAYVLAMAGELGVVEGTPEWAAIQRGALLHDVGKIGVRDEILHKPGPLTPEEWDDMKRHPGIGHAMLKDISFLKEAAEIVHCHHERFDGKGYPRGLASDEVPLGARIFAAADAFDAMTSDRPYRKALLPEMAREEIIRHSGTQFDPQVVQAFLLVYDTIQERAAAEHAAEARARAA